MDISQEFDEIKRQPFPPKNGLSRPVPPPKPKNVPSPTTNLHSPGAQISPLKKSANIAKLINTIENSLNNPASKPIPFSVPILKPCVKARANSNEATKAYKIVKSPSPVESPSTPIPTPTKLFSNCGLPVGDLGVLLRSKTEHSKSNNNNNTSTNKAPPKPVRTSLLAKKTSISNEEKSYEEEKNVIEKFEVQTKKPVIKSKPRIAPKPELKTKNQSVSFAPFINDNNTDTDTDSNQNPDQFQYQDSDTDSDSEHIRYRNQDTYDNYSSTTKTEGDKVRSRGILKSRNNSSRSRSTPFVSTKNERYILLNNKYHNSKFNTSAKNYLESRQHNLINNNNNNNSDTSAINNKNLKNTPSLLLKENNNNNSSSSSRKPAVVCGAWRKAKSYPSIHRTSSIQNRFQATAQVQLQQLRPFGNLKNDVDLIKPSLIKNNNNHNKIVDNDNNNNNNNNDTIKNSSPSSSPQVVSQPKPKIQLKLKSQAPPPPSLQFDPSLPAPRPPPRQKRKSLIEPADVSLAIYNNKNTLPTPVNNSHKNKDESSNNNNNDDNNSKNAKDSFTIFNPSSLQKTDKDIVNSDKDYNNKSSNNGITTSSNEVQSSNEYHKYSNNSNSELFDEEIPKISPHYTKVNKCKRWPSHRRTTGRQFFKNKANIEKTSLLAENVIPFMLDQAKQINNNNNSVKNDLSKSSNECPFICKTPSFRLSGNLMASTVTPDGIKKKQLELLPESEEMAVALSPFEDSIDNEDHETPPPSTKIEQNQKIFTTHPKSSTPITLNPSTEEEEDEEEQVEKEIEEEQVEEEAKVEKDKEEPEYSMPKNDCHKNYDNIINVSEPTELNELHESTTFEHDNNSFSYTLKKKVRKTPSLSPPLSTLFISNLNDADSSIPEQSDEDDKRTDNYENTNDVNSNTLHKNLPSPSNVHHEEDQTRLGDDDPKEFEENTKEVNKNAYDKMVDVPLVFISDCDDNKSDPEYDTSSSLSRRKKNDSDDESYYEPKEGEIIAHETSHKHESLLSQINSMFQNGEDWYSDEKNREENEKTKNTNKNNNRKQDDCEEDKNIMRRSLFRPRSRSQSRSRSKSRERSEDDDGLSKSPQTKRKNSTSLLDLVDIEIQKVQNILADITTVNKKKSVDGGCTGIYKKHNGNSSNNNNNNNNNNYYSKNLSPNQPKSVLLRKSSVPELRVAFSEFKPDDDQDHDQKLIRHSWATKSTSSIGSTTSSSSLSSVSQSKNAIGSMTPGKQRRKSDFSQWFWIDEGEMSGAGGDVECENSSLHSSHEEIRFLENSGRPLFRRKKTVADFFGKARKTSMASLVNASMIWKQNVKKKSNADLQQCLQQQQQQQFQQDLLNESPPIQVMFADNNNSFNENNNVCKTNPIYDEDEEFEAELVELNRKSEQETYDKIMNQLSPKAKKAFYVVREILTSEKTFVDVLHLITVDFPRSLQKTCQRLKITHDLISDPDLEYILGGLPILKGVNEDILHDLEERVSNWTENSKISDIFVKKGAFLKHYTNYIKDFEKVSKFFDNYCEKNSQFAHAVKYFEISKRCQNLGLKPYMLKPVQRMPQYGLLLEDYLKNLQPGHVDYNDTLKAITIVRNVAEHANEAIRIQNVMERLLLLQERLPNLDILGTNKTLIKEGELMKVCRKDMQPRYFALMNDCLLCMAYSNTSTLNNPNLKELKVKYELPLSRMRVISCPSQEVQYEFSIIGIARSFTVVAKSTKDKDEWVDALNTAINEYTKIAKNCPSPTLEIDLNQYNLGKEAPIWTQDQRSSSCQLCNHEFNMVFRRHHCRACGHVVCRRCSNNESPLEYLNFNTARVCDSCYDVLLEECEQLLSLDPVKYNQRRLKFKKFSVNFSSQSKRAPKSKKTVVRLPSRPQIKDGDSSPKLKSHLSWKEKKIWKRNYFVLVDCVLYIFQTNQDTECIQTIPVLGYELAPGSEEDKLMNDVSFRLKHKGRGTILFQAENSMLAKRWIQALEQATSLC